MTKAVIIDLDGTLCDVKHRLHLIEQQQPRDWDTFHSLCVNDSVNDWCKQLAESYISTEVEVFFMTGRPIKYEAETRAWLEKNLAPSTKRTLLMKPDGDFRKDYQFKEEMYLKLRDEYDFILAMDDREETIEMWNKYGIFTLHYSS